MSGTQLAWNFLHRHVRDRESYNFWLSRAEGVVARQCFRNWEAIARACPPDFSSPEAIFAWGVDRHNDINRRLGKPAISLDEAKKIHL